MNQRNFNEGFSKRQNGAVLVVALIILTALTLVGVSSMQSTTLEMRMVNSSIERNKSFTEVEAAIARAINTLEAHVDSLTDLHNDDPSVAMFSSQCTGIPSGDLDESIVNVDTPQGGWCFFGSYKKFMSHTYECRSGNVEAWRSESGMDVWTTDGRHTVSTINPNIKYIIEFKCFVSRDRNAPYGPYLGGNDESDPLFVITAYMESSATNRRPPIMIQVSHTVRI